MREGISHGGSFVVWGECAQWVWGECAQWCGVSVRSGCRNAAAK